MRFERGIIAAMSDFSLLQLASDFPPGAKIRDVMDKETGIRILVSRGWLGFCCYLGVPAEHLLAGVEDLRITCPGGITFQEWGSEGTLWEPGWYWWGWDYQHAGDKLDLDGPLQELGPLGVELLRLLKRTQRAIEGPTPREPTVDQLLQDAQAAAKALQVQLTTAKALTETALRGIRPSSNPDINAQ